MGLREQIEADLEFILEDSIMGFWFDIRVTDPSENADDFVGFSNDIAQAIDPDTGQLVSGRVASVALRISSLTNKGFGLPVGIADKTSKPWIVAFNDINGNPFTFKVSESHPDRATGIITCFLELYSV